MKQFIRYLYEYQEGKPVRNAGFVKAEQGDARTVLHIHGKGLRLGPERELALYLFYMENGRPVGIWQGSIRNINPAVNCRLIYTPEDTGEPENYGRIRGVILESAGQRRFAAAWDDMPVEPEKLRPWQERRTVPESVTEAAMHAVREAEEDSLSGSGPDGKAGEEPERPDVSGGSKAVPAAVCDSGGPEAKSAVACGTGPEAGTAERPAEASGAAAVTEGFRCRKISRQDIAMLPRCEWRLANNSFLLHGYYNYHYLLLIEDGEQAWLGVPGIYHRREARAAEAFGFPLFVPEAELCLRPPEEKTAGCGAVKCRTAEQPAEVTAEEPSEQAVKTDAAAGGNLEQAERFGFWCRRIRRLSCRNRT